MKYMDRIICTLAGAWVALQGVGQVTGSSSLGNGMPGDHCGTSASHAQRLANDPAYAHRHSTFEEAMRQHVLFGAQSGDRSLVVVPIVVHIIHDGGWENIPDAQVLTAISHLNEGFANTGYYDPGTGVDTGIQFCLALRDPEGGFSTGINRVQSPFTDMVKETEDQTLKSLIDWDPSNYVNIWVVRSITSQSQGPGVAGYAYLPAAHGTSYDGIVVEAEYFGTSAANDVVIIHELGHYLGLYHTFEGGCPNADCLSDGDRVCDTPPDASTAAIVCEETMNTCTSDPQDESLNNPFRPIGNGGLGDQPDQYLNFMDYGLQECKTMFTQGQSDRMHATLEVERNSLLQSNACQSPCSIPFNASFTVTPTPPVVIGTQVTLTNTTAAATGYQWAVNGAWFSDNTDETYSLPEEGEFTFTLTASDSVNFCQDTSSVLVEVYCPGEASFTTSGNVVPIGGHVLFTNTSTPSNSYQWYLDGDPHANTEHDSIHFDQPGIYTVHLVAQTPLCPNTSSTATIQVGQCPVEGHRMFWHFGNHAGLDFNNGGPVALTNSPMLCHEGTTDMSDDDGNLLFYSDGRQVWARNNMVMANGSGLLGGQTGSARNQALAAHRPGHPDQYVLFTHDQFEDNGLNGLRYSVIDMTLNGGYGAVTGQKNVLIHAPNQDETMAGAYAANGEDIWLVEGRSYDHSIAVYRMDGDLTITGSIVDFAGYQSIANVAFSPSGKRLHISMGSTSPFQIYSRLFDFDLETGELSNPIDLPLPAWIYQVEFSPDGSKLYIPTNTQIVQYDLSLTTESAIQNSATVVATGLNAMVGMRRAPDGRIYYAGGGGLRSIAQPNLPGSACDVQLTPVDLAGHNVIIGLPLFMCGRRIDAEIDLQGPDSVCMGAAADMYVADADTTCAFTWFVDDVLITPTGADTLLAVPPTGTDSVLVRVDKTCDCGAATTSKWLRYVPAPPFTLANDTAICITDPLLLNPGPGYTDHLWQDGSTTSSFTVTSAGTYWLHVTDPLGCSVSDTVLVDMSENLPLLDLGADDTLCAGLTHVLDAGAGYLMYHWQDGSMEQMFTAWEAGTYWVTVSNGCGAATDTIVLLSGEAGPLTLGSDSILCTWIPQQLQGPAGWAHYLWQDGSTGTTFDADSAGIYWLTVTDDRGCSSRDTIVLQLDDAPPVLICTPDTTVLMHGDGGTLEVQMPPPIASDPCGLTLTNSITGTGDASAEYPLGSTPIIWTAVDDLGNMSTCTTILTVSSPDAIEEVDGGTIVIFPNPGQGFFHVRWSGEAPIRLDVLDALGRVVHSSVPMVNNDTFMLDLSTRAVGWYTLRSIMGGRTRCTPFMIGLAVDR